MGKIAKSTKTPPVWALHGYMSINAPSGGSTTPGDLSYFDRFKQAVHGKIWITEAGAFNGMKYLLNTIIPGRDRITHFFYYNWDWKYQAFGTGLNEVNTTPHSPLAASTPTPTPTAAPPPTGTTPYCLFYYRRSSEQTRSSKCK